MARKQTYFHRDFAIVHRAFASEQTEGIFHQCIVNRVGDSKQLFATATLDEAKRAIDEFLEARGDGKRWAERITV
jgi:hypothetical protein